MVTPESEGFLLLVSLGAPESSSSYFSSSWGPQWGVLFPSLELPPAVASPLPPELDGSSAQHGVHRPLRPHPLTVCSKLQWG